MADGLDCTLSMPIFRRVKLRIRVDFRQKKCDVGKATGDSEHVNLLRFTRDGLEQRIRAESITSPP